MARLREIEVELLDEIEFHNKGGVDTADKVLLRAPSSKNRKDASKILRIWRAADFKRTRAIVASMSEEQRKASDERNAKQDDTVNDGEEENHTGEELSDEFMSIIEGHSSDEEIELMYASFLSILKNGCGFVNEVPITGGIWEQFSFEDERFLCGVYAMDFLSQSKERKKGGKN